MPTIIHSLTKLLSHFALITFEEKIIGLPKQGFVPEKVKLPK